MDFSEIVKTILQTLPDASAIYCFGSTGTPWENAESDLDIAILPTRKIDSSTRFELANQLSSVAHKEFVDVVDLFEAPPVLKKEVALKGRRIYCKDLMKAEVFEDLAFSQDLFFNEERKDLVADILARGSVY